MSVNPLGRGTFASLSNKNYRRFMFGQMISLMGTWMQIVAQAWLVLQLTGSATQLGLIIALQTLPILLLGPYGGVVADRMDKRRLLLGVQTCMGLLALILGILTITDTVTIVEVYVLAVLLGCNNCFENPARQSFVLELVGPQDLRNAVSLNSVMGACARTVGPAIGGIVIAAGGLGFCFLLNAATFVAVIVSLIRLDTSALMPSVPTKRAKGQLREGLVYVWHTPSLLAPLVMMAVVGCLAYEFQVTLPVLAKETFHGGAQVYSYMTAAMGLGAVFGGLFVAARGRTGLLWMVITGLVFGVCVSIVAAAPNLVVAIVALFAVGASSIGFISTGNSSLQLASSPPMRGRVMALWAVAFLGSTPIGGPVAGLVSEYGGPRIGLAMAAVACFGAAGYGWVVYQRSTRSALADSATPEIIEIDDPSSVEVVR